MASGRELSLDVLTIEFRQRLRDTTSVVVVSLSPDLAFREHRYNMQGVWAWHYLPLRAVPVLNQCLVNASVCETIHSPVLVMPLYHPMCILHPKHVRVPAPENEWSPARALNRLEWDERKLARAFREGLRAATPSGYSACPYIG